MYTRWKNFHLQFQSSSATTAKVSDIRPKHVDQNKNVLSAERTIPTKDSQVEKQGNQNAIKDWHSGNMWSKTKKLMRQLSTNTLSRSPKPQLRHFLSRPNEQLAKFVANVVIQIAQPQVCYPNPKQDTLDLKSSICRKVFNAAKTILNVDITAKDLFESIGSLGAPVLPVPFKLRSTKASPVSKPISKASTVLKCISPPSKIPKATAKQPTVEHLQP